MPKGRTLCLLAMASMLIAATCAETRAKEKETTIDWQPITASDLALKDNPEQPGSSAMILYREVKTDDKAGFEIEYFRIKILKEDGKKYADIAFPFVKGSSLKREFEAHTIQPDGKIIDFDGEGFVKVVAKHKGIEVLAKTYSLPNVQVGTIIDYKSTITWAPIHFEMWETDFLKGLAPDRATHWTIQQELFTRRAHFSFRSAPGMRLNCAWFGLAEGKKPVNENDTFKLDVENIPAFEHEEYMPPEDALKARVDFFYIYSVPKGADTKTSDWFWKDLANRRGKNMEDFIEKHKDVNRAEAESASANDPPEAKLRKIYERVQQIHNLSFDREKTEKEEKREKFKDNYNVDDVLKHGYGSGFEINALFAAMARAAGFDAFMVRVATRDSKFFSPNVLDFGQLNSIVVEVKVGNTIRFFDPATLYCPYGLLPWEESGSKGIELKKEGSEFVNTSDLVSSESVVERKATLQMGLDREMEGKMDLKYVGQEALSRRLENRDADEAARRKYLEEEMKGWLPSGSTVELAGDPNWSKTEEALHAVFNVKIPNVGTPTGKRLLLPPTIFEINQTYPFKSEKRTYPVYFRFPYQVVDDVTLKVPQGFQVESLPKAKNVQNPLGQYDISYDAQGGTVHVARRLALNGIFYRAEYYPALRSIFVAARAGDEQQMVLTASASAGNN